MPEGYADDSGCVQQNFPQSLFGRQLKHLAGGGDGWGGRPTLTLDAPPASYVDLCLNSLATGTDA
jgi:hypothetical protein